MFIWNLWWFRYAIFELQTSPFHTSYLFHPHGASLLVHTFSPLNGLLALIFAPVFNLVITYNLLVMLTFIVGAFGMYKLGHHLTKNHAAGFIAGLVYAFNPSHLAQAAHHLNIASNQLLPLLLLAAIRWIETKQRRFAIWTAIILGINFYLDYYLFMFGCVMLVCIFALAPKAAELKTRFRLIGQGIAIIGLATLLTIPLLIPMVQEMARTNFPTLAGHNDEVIDLVGFLFPHAYHWTRSSLLNRIVNIAFTGHPWEATGFLGYFVLPMAMIGILRREFRWKAAFIGIALVGTLMAMGSHPHICGQSLSFIKLPVYFLAKLPGISAARTPARFIVLTYTGLAVFCAFAAARWLQVDGIRRRAGLVLFFSAAVILDYWSAPMVISHIEVPRFLHRLRHESDQAAMLNLPLVGWLENERYMFYQTIHQKPICGGQLARHDVETANPSLQQLALTRSWLQSMGIKYVMIDSSLMSLPDYQKIMRQLSQELDLEASENGRLLYRVY